jgi:predicted permease
MNLLMTLLMTFAVQTLGLLQAAEEKPDLTINYIIIGALLLVAVVLGAIVMKRRMNEKDDDWDA